MKCLVSEGYVLSLTAPSGGVVEGNFYKIGGFIGAATCTAAQGDVFGLRRKGEFNYTAEGAGSGQDLAEGDAIYWDNTAKQFTKTSSGNTLFGYATAAKVTTATTAQFASL